MNEGILVAFGLIGTFAFGFLVGAISLVAVVAALVITADNGSDE